MVPAIPLSSILPPSLYDPGVSLPSPSFALLGPLPPTTPIRLALDYLALADLPEYASEGNVNHTDRVLIVTSSRREWTEEIIDQDEDWLREHGGEYGVLQKLKRVDIRACPTLDHVRLLLSLGSDKGSNATHLDPSVIILWDVGRLIMRQVEDDENHPLSEKRDWEVKHGVALSDYMDIISSAKSVQHYFTSLPDAKPVQLCILEPHFDQLTSLPILKSVDQREKRVSIKAALEWALGDVVGLVTPEEDNRYRITLPEETFHLKKRACARDFEGTGWRWEWTI